jgi:GrpB-like predicted nucleotidyltransferase (UPF0157 family)
MQEPTIEEAIGLRYDKVKLVSYKSDWETLYKQEENLIYSAFPKTNIQVEHIGSTSIPGLAAKPIIDIMVGVAETNPEVKHIKRLTNLNHRYFGECGRPGRLFFVKESSEVTTHHLHLVACESQFWQDNLLFRDALRESNTLAKQYIRLKKKLAREYSNDREGYRKENLILSKA